MIVVRVKRHLHLFDNAGSGFDPGDTYPDHGCNTETYTDPSMLEVETLGALKKIQPDGNVEHTEHWFLYRMDVGDTEASMDEKLVPLIRATEKFKP